MCLLHMKRYLLLLPFQQGAFFDGSSGLSYVMQEAILDMLRPFWHLEALLAWDLHEEFMHFRILCCNVLDTCDHMGYLYGQPLGRSTTSITVTMRSPTYDICSKHLFFFRDISHPSRINIFIARTHLNFFFQGQSNQISIFQERHFSRGKLFFEFFGGYFQ